MNWFLAALKKYAVFSGRARRSEYWYFALFYLLIYIALAVADNVMNAGASFGLLSGIFSLAMLIPSLSVGVRRLHDTDRSGWWLLIALVPVLGAIALIAFAVQDSQPGENRFGLSPKAA
jgi:uncharacterized membrane protein YhaH (DUF805 family)